MSFILIKIMKTAMIFAVTVCTSLHKSKIINNDNNGKNS